MKVTFDMETLKAWLIMLSTLDTHSKGTKGNLILKPKEEGQIDFNFDYGRLSNIHHQGLKFPGLTVELNEEETELFRRASFAAAYLFEESGRPTDNNSFIKMHNRLFKKD